MRLPKSWLCEYIDFNVTDQEFIEKMMWRGFELDGYEKELNGISGVITGKILKMEPHPNANKLTVCQVDLGDKTAQILTNAKNVFEGAVVPVAYAGAKIGSQEFTVANIRGVESYGMFCSGQAKKHIGEIMLGFAVLMFGMKAMSGSVYELRSSETFVNMLTTFSNPLLGIALGIVFTSVIQSASAAVGILQALAVTGAIRFDIALPIIMGIAIGAAVPVLLSALGASADGKRTALSYLMVDTLGVILFSIVFYTLNAICDFSFMSTTMTTVSLALMNTVFRFVIVLMLAPFISLLERICKFIIKDKPEDAAVLEDFERLEERFLDHPALAVEQSRLTVNSMAKKARENLFDAFALIGSYSEEGFQHITETEDIVDKYEDKLGTYLIHITSRELNSEQNEAVGKYLHTINDFERISDHALNVAECAQELHEKGIVFSEDAAREVNVLISAVTEVMNTAIDAFCNNDLENAYRVEPLEELIDNLCDEMKLHHIDRLQKGICTLNHGFVFNDLITNLERISDHCSNIAVAIIELESDSFDTHEYINSLIEVRSHCFDEYYAEYSKKFVL